VLGVGAIYSTALDPLITAAPELFDVLEIEPQTFWIETEDVEEPYLVPDGVADHLASLPGRKLVHSVGTPVGGSVRANEAQFPMLRESIRALDAPWASEHLAFNLSDQRFAGFFLPPRQTEGGVPVYVDAIGQLGVELQVPIAFETGVNYLRPRGDELSDGAFVTAVADAADCGILLDLHNVYCNARNGRQPVEAFLSEIPLDRVWEVHLAGGFEMDGFWLDSHSGEIPEDVMAIARAVVPALPNLKAVNFEIFPSFLPRFGLDAVRYELERVHDLWARRRPPTTPVEPRTPRPDIPAGAGREQIVAVRAWERALTDAVLEAEPSSPLGHDLAGEPGSQLVATLIKEFRASMVVNVYPLSSRLMMLALGPDVFRAILEDFWRTAPPSQFAGTEADAFATYLGDKGLRLPQLQNVLAFERASLATMRDGETRVVSFNIDPMPLLRGLLDGELLVDLGDPGDYEIEVTGEGTFGVSAGQVATVG
jgi:uncharacterized protein